jgi:hypothetical protein
MPVYSDYYQITLFNSSFNGWLPLIAIRLLAESSGLISGCACEKQVLESFF